jgi:hypothetical protein
MTLYTIYDSEGFFWCEYHENKPQNATSTLYTDNFIKPRYNAVTDSFFEAATEQEIEEARKAAVPQIVSKMRFFLSLYNIGITRTMVYDAINQIEDSDLKEIILIKFDLSQEFDRNDEHLNLMAGVFGITEEQLDDLFVQSNI